MRARARVCVRAVYAILRARHATGRRSVQIAKRRGKKTSFHERMANANNRIKLQRSAPRYDALMTSFTRTGFCFGLFRRGLALCGGFTGLGGGGVSAAFALVGRFGRGVYVPRFIANICIE